MSGQLNKYSLTVWGMSCFYEWEGVYGPAMCNGEGPGIFQLVSVVFPVTCWTLWCTSVVVAAPQVEAGDHISPGV